MILALPVPNLCALVASTTDYLIGDRDALPWEHRGDLRRFFQLTKRHALLFGTKTFVGILKNYSGSVKPGAEILPGRKLFVEIDQRRGYHSFLKHESLIPSNGRLTCLDVQAEPLDQLDAAFYELRDPSTKLFVSGGARTYDRYLRFCETIFVTLVTVPKRLTLEAPTYLSSESQQVLNSHDWNVTVCGEEVERDATATYLRLDRRPRG